MYEDTENIKSAKPTQDENRRAVRASKRTTQNQGVLSNLSNAPEVQQPVPVTTQFGAYDKSNWIVQFQIVVYYFISLCRAWQNFQRIYVVLFCSYFTVKLSL